MESSWHRACKDTEHFRHSPWSWALGIVGVAIFGCGGSYWGFLLTPIDGSHLDEFAYPTIGGVVGVIGGFILVFLIILLWNLFRAPYIQRNEAWELLKEKESAELSKKKEILEALTSTYTKGSDLLSQNINSEDELKIWKAFIDIWQSLFLTLVKNHVSPTDYALYRLVQYKPDQKRTGSYNTEHNDLRNKLAARLIQVEELIRRFMM